MRRWLRLITSVALVSLSAADTGVRSSEGVDTAGQDVAGLLSQRLNSPALGANPETVGKSDKLVGEDGGTEEEHQDEGGQDEEGEEEEEEEEEPSETTMAVSVMLLGSVTFQMVLWYLVHYPDKDIRMYTWRMLGDTISIFAAVLLFTALDGVVVNVFGESVAVELCFMFFWFVVLQLVTGIMAGAFSTRTDMVEHQVELLKKQHKIEFKTHQIRELNIRCFSQMLAHMTGFAAIRGFGALMQMDQFNKCPILVLPIALIALVALFQGSDLIREWIAVRDGSGKDAEEMMWDEGAEEAENDVIALTLSFLGLSCIRYRATGVLPTMAGEDELEASNSILMAACACWGAMFAGLVLNALSIVGKRKLEPAGASVKTELQNPIQYRLVNSLGAFGMMLAAWGSLYGVVYVMMLHGWEVEDIITKVVAALSVSFLACLIIIFLDKIADADFTGKMADDILIGIIFSKSLLIGFSWEKAFDSAVEAIAESKVQNLGVHPGMGKLFLSLFVVIVVVPAYRSHIMPKIITLEEKFKEDHEGHGEDEGAHDHGHDTAALAPRGYVMPVMENNSQAANAPPTPGHAPVQQA